MGATETVDLFMELINDDRREKAIELLAEHAVMGISVPGSDERTNLRGRDKVGGWFVRAGDGFRMYANDSRSMGASGSRPPARSGRSVSMTPPWWRMTMIRLRSCSDRRMACHKLYRAAFTG